MSELSAVPFSALPPASDGYTVLYENDQVCRSDKKLSELVGSRTSSFLTKDQGDNLYQEKGNYLVPDDLDEYATQTWVENEISKIGSYVIVNETTGEDNHPDVQNPSTKVIYLTKQTEGKFDNYNEWIYKDDTDVFECIGETTLDLENYYRKTETSGAGELSAEFNKYLKIPTNIEANKQYAYSTTGWNEIVANADQYETETVTIRHKSGCGDAPLYEVTANAGKLIYINQGSVPTTDIQQIELTLNNVENTNKPYFAYVTVSKILNLCSFVVKDENGTYFTPADCKSYCWLVGDGNSSNKVYLIEFLPNKTFFAHRIGNTDNTKFIEVTKTTGKQYYDYVHLLTNDNYMPFIKTDQGIAVFAYKTLGDNLVFQTSPNENGEMQKITFVNNSYTIKTETVSFNANSNSWKQLSEEHGSSGELDDENFCVYLGAENSSFNDSYTLGRNNYSEQGLNIGYINKIDINEEEDLYGIPGTINIGKLNSAIGTPGAINVGQGNSAYSFGVNIGEWSNASSGSYNLGSYNSAQNGAVNIGLRNNSFTAGFCVGVSNSANNNGFTMGERNSAQNLGVGIGQSNLAQNCGFCLGQLNKASANAIGIGYLNTAFMNSYCVGNGNSADLEGYVFGTRSTASYLGICVGNSLNAIRGAIAIGVRCEAQDGGIVMGANNHGSGCNLVFGTVNNFSASNIIGHNNKALNSNIFGNSNTIDKNLVSDSALSAEQYIKSGYNVESATVFIRNFVAGVGNSAEYAKNAYIFGNENKVICESSADYLNVDNDGFTYLFGYKNSAARNYDIAIGYKTIASGGENIAIGAPFQTITGYSPYDGGYYLTGEVNTQARGYKNIAIRSTITGINNIAYNSTLTGNLMNLTSTWVNEELSKVVDNQITNSWVSGTTSGNYAAMQKNIIDNANIIFSSYSFNNNRITNTYGLGIFGNFSNNTILNSNNISLFATVDEYSNSNNNTIIGCENFSLSSKNIVDNLLLNIKSNSTNIAAEKLIKDNILIKTNFVPCSSMSSINENIVFNSLIYGYNDSAYRGWGEGNDSNTTFTRNFIFGTHVGNYVYNTFSFSDNSNSDPDYYRLSNTIRTFNFGDNGITKAENSFVFGLQNNATSINRCFVFGYTNNLYKAPTYSTQDYIMDAFVFGISNNLINECTYSDPTLENTTIFGQHNYVKSKNTCSYNYIVGLKNSITYFTDIPSKSTIANEIAGRTYPPELRTNSAAFQTTRNRIFGNSIKLTHGITDSFVAGISNYVIDTKEYPASAQPGNADYNSIYMFGVGNVAYDGSNQLNIGYNNETSGHFAEAIGDGIIAKEQQLIIGKCNAVVDGTNRYSIEYDSATDTIKNVEQSGVIFAIGNGTYDYAYEITNDEYSPVRYYDKNKNVIPTANFNNEEYITRSNALIVSANGVVSANDYYNAAGDKLSDLAEVIALLRNKPTTGTHVIKCIDGTLTWVAET